MESRLWLSTWDTKTKSTNWAGNLFIGKIFCRFALTFYCAECPVKKQDWFCVNHTHLAAFYRSKIFIRFPKTLFTTEDALEAKKPEIGKQRWYGSVSVWDVKLQIFKYNCRIYSECTIKYTLFSLCFSTDPADIMERLQRESQVPTHQTCRSDHLQLFALSQCTACPFKEHPLKPEYLSV